MTRRAASRVPPEELLAALLRHEKGLSDFVRQHRGIHDRMYRFDFCWPSKLVAVEVDGGSWLPKGGHTTGAGYERDRERDALAVCQGWRVLRFTSSQIQRNPDFVLGCIRKLLLTSPQRCSTGIEGGTTMASIDYSKIPVLTMQGIQRYIEKSIPTGHFLGAVMAHDLFEAVGRADADNLAALPHIVAWIYNKAPSQCHGSAEKVKHWLEQGEDIQAMQRLWVEIADKRKTTVSGEAI